MQGIEMIILMQLSTEYQTLGRPWLSLSGPRFRCFMCRSTFSIYALAILFLFVVSKMHGHNFLWSHDFLEWGYLLMCTVGPRIGELPRGLTAWHAAENQFKPIKESSPQSLF